MSDLPARQSLLVLPLLLAGATAVHGASASTEDVQVGRYSSVRPVPTAAQVDLLSALVTVQFPEKVRTVRQAVEQLLAPSGYRLAADAVADPERAVLLALPLPEPHRALGPMPLRLALETLAGPAFRLVEDSVHRLVSFERCEPSAGETAGPVPRGGEVTPVEALAALLLVIGVYALGPLTSGSRPVEPCSHRSPSRWRR